MTTRGEFSITAVQATPAYLDREATLDIVVDEIAKAAADDADLVVFPESFVPGYPDWLWRHNPWSDTDWYARFQDQAIEIPGPALDKVRAAADAACVWVALGITERTPSGTLYNAVVYIDAPTWDNSDEWVPTLRHTAKEGQVFVVGVTAFLCGSDVPRDLPGADEIYGGEDDFMSKGNTTIVAPGGEIIAGPLIGEKGTVSATLDLDRIAAGRRAFDPTGHYARPDILSLTINRDGDDND